MADYNPNPPERISFLEKLFINLPELLPIFIWTLVLVFVGLYLGGLIKLWFSNRKQFWVELKYRIEFSFMGINIIWPPMWCVVILAIWGVIFCFWVWFL